MFHDFRRLFFLVLRSGFGSRWRLLVKRLAQILRLAPLAQISTMKPQTRRGGAGKRRRRALRELFQGWALVVWRRWVPSFVRRAVYARWRARALRAVLRAWYVHAFGAYVEQRVLLRRL
jgi:hypothetical protein